jgi:hypothetical protein
MRKGGDGDDPVRAKGAGRFGVDGNSVRRGNALLGAI